MLPSLEHAPERLARVLIEHDVRLRKQSDLASLVAARAARNRHALETSMTNSNAGLRATDRHDRSTSINTPNGARATNPERRVGDRDPATQPALRRIHAQQSRVAQSAPRRRRFRRAETLTVTIKPKKPANARARERPACRNTSSCPLTVIPAALSVLCAPASFRMQGWPVGQAHPTRSSAIGGQRRYPAWK